MTNTEFFTRFVSDEYNKTISGHTFFERALYKNTNHAEILRAILIAKLDKTDPRFEQLVSNLD